MFRSIVITTAALCLFGIAVETRPSKKCIEKAADIMFVLDSSSSIWIVDYNKQLKFLADLVDGFGVGSANSEIRVGAITFSDRAHLEFSLDRYSDPKQLRNAILNIVHRHGSTNTADALKLLKQQVEPTLKTRKAPVIAVVITDGESTNPAATKEEAKKLHQLGIHVYAIGVGSSRNYDINELKAIASDPENGVYTVSSYSALDEIVQKFHVQRCEAEINPTMPTTIITTTTEVPTTTTTTETPTTTTTTEAPTTTTETPTTTTTETPTTTTTEAPTTTTTEAPTTTTTTEAPTTTTTEAPTTTKTTEAPTTTTTEAPTTTTTEAPTTTTTEAPTTTTTEAPTTTTTEAPTTTTTEVATTTVTSTTKKPTTEGPEDKPQNAEPHKDKASIILFGYDLVAMGAYRSGMIHQFINTILPYSGYGHFGVVSYGYCPSHFNVPITSLMDKDPSVIKNGMVADGKLPDFVDVVRKMRSVLKTRAKQNANSGHVENQVAVLFIDPSVTTITPELTKEIEMLKKSGVKLHLVNVGPCPWPQLEQLNSMSSQPHQKHMFSSPSYHQLVLQAQRNPFYFKHTYNQRVLKGLKF